MKKALYIFFLSSTLVRCNLPHVQPAFIRNINVNSAQHIQTVLPQAKDLPRQLVKPVPLGSSQRLQVNKNHARLPYKTAKSESVKVRNSRKREEANNRQLIQENEKSDGGFIDDYSSVSIFKEPALPQEQVNLRQLFKEPAVPHEQVNLSHLFEEHVALQDSIRIEPQKQPEVSYMFKQPAAPQGKTFEQKVEKHVALQNSISMERVQQQPKIMSEFQAQKQPEVTNTLVGTLKNKFTNWWNGSSSKTTTNVVIPEQITKVTVQDFTRLK